MVNARSTNNKKRSASTKIQAKPAKALKKEGPVEEIEQEQDQDNKSEGLFDNLDEEMDPAAMEDIMNQLDENSQSEEEEVEEEEEEEEEEEGEEEEEEEEEEIEEEEEEDKMEEDEQVPISTEQQSTAKRFRDSYMTKVTQAFGSDLDTIRQEPNLSGPRLNILIDSLEAGIDIFSTLEQEIILADEEK